MSTESTAHNYESTAHLVSELGDITFPLMSTDWEDQPYAVELAQAVNWQSQTIAETHRMVQEMYGVFMKLKPLVDSIPAMPAGLMMPGTMPLPGMPRFPNQR